jgi:hypothetical protein
MCSAWLVARWCVWSVVQSTNDRQRDTAAGAGVLDMALCVTYHESAPSPFPANKVSCTRGWLSSSASPQQDCNVHKAIIRLECSSWRRMTPCNEYIGSHQICAQNHPPPQCNTTMWWRCNDARGICEGTVERDRRTWSSWMWPRMAAEPTTSSSTTAMECACACSPHGVIMPVCFSFC